MTYSDKANTKEFLSKQAFRPATPWNWLISVVQNLFRVDLFFNNRPQILERDILQIESLPPGSGVLLLSNHADESDFKLCVEVSRRCKRRFYYMMNREAFDEVSGLAGWLFQRLGAFSVERGGDTAKSKGYAVDVVAGGRDVLVVFPEGEIYYLNDTVQHFKSGAIDIAMQALSQGRANDPDWSVYVVPMAIKYYYRHSIADTLEKRVLVLEKKLSYIAKKQALKERIGSLLSEVLHRKEIALKLAAGSERLSELSGRVKDVQQNLLHMLEDRYGRDHPADGTAAIDRSWRLSSHLRQLVADAKSRTSKAMNKLRSDLSELKHIAEMDSWQPNYIADDPSQERLAEMVLKLEREVCGVKRPLQVAPRSAFVRIAKPIDLKKYLPDYKLDPRKVRRDVTEEMHQTIQNLIDGLEKELHGVPSKQEG
ncbi:MAG: 1-acyl-sn-glycerol-3-phosphate acyltransferase [Candidatus Melainabacteria bacterium]|nr:1-acyl-sn-glycerol-3-phosphate acyltransferase [Candidatus Melainabacteria bacterium]